MLHKTEWKTAEKSYDTAFRINYYNDQNTWQFSSHAAYTKKVKKHQLLQKITNRTLTYLSKKVQFKYNTRKIKLNPNKRHYVAAVFMNSS